MGKEDEPMSDPVSDGDEDYKMEDAEEGATFALPESSRRDLEEQEKLIQEFELRRKIKTVVVPTDDVKVRQMLRLLGEPITLFGERQAERRERLQKIVALRDEPLPEAPIIGQLVVEEMVGSKELFYTEGPQALKAARQQVAAWSLRRAKQRIAGAKARQEQPELQQQWSDAGASSLEQAKRLGQQSSEIGADRPIAGCAFSPDGQLLATCCWGGMLSIWDGAKCSKQASVRTHDERCTGVAWHPHAGASGRSEGVLALATGGVDGSAVLLDAQGKQLRRIQGHTDRLGRVAFHPMGRHLATASFDMTWRLWDCESGECLLEQEGHSRGVYAVAFQQDGALAGSVGLDAIGRVWDCRTGRSILTLQGHVKQCLAIDFSPNGYHVATGSDDHTCRVWDLRKKGCLYTIPAHKSLLSTVRYEPSSGHYLLTSSYDALAKVYNASDFSCVKVLAGHEGKVMCADVSPSGNHTVATVSYDRTLKLWAPEDTPAFELF